MSYLFLLFFFILGSVIGSFLNVLTLRYNTGSFLNKRSACLSCGHTLSLRDLFPIISFFLLGGKCGYCKSKISIQYPLVEFLTALTFLFTYIKIETLGIELLFYLIVWSIFIAILIYDLRHKIIPNGLVYTLIILSLIRVLWLSYPDFGIHIWSLLAGPIAASPFAFLWLVSGGRWMGFGDAKLALAMGWLLGLLGVISAITFAFWIGAIVGLFLVALSKIPSSLGRRCRPGQAVFRLPSSRVTIKSEIPFAPFLIVGTAIVFFLGINLSNLFIL